VLRSASSAYILDSSHLVLVAACSSADDALGPPGGSLATTTTGSGSGGGGGGGASTTTGTGGAGGDADARFGALVAAIEAERAIYGDPAVAVAVIEHGEVTFARGFGSKRPGGDEAAGPETLFRIGSVTKMITAAALLQREAAGDVDLDAPVTDYVPAFHFTQDDTWAPTVTLRHLLTHASGMYDYLEVDAPPAEQGDDALSAFVDGRFADLGYLMAPAGSFYNYSNPNFYLAGLTTEAVTGTSYRQYVHDHVLAPLGMSRTFFLPSEVLADGDYAVGSSSYPGVDREVAPDSYENPWGRLAGYAFSSVLDLAKFATMLLQGNDEVLPAAQRQAMMSAQVSTRELLELSHYGYGLFLLDGAYLGSPDEFYSLGLVRHGGDIPGFAADVELVPSLDFAFVAVAAADGVHLTQSYVTALHTLTELPAPEAPPDVSFPTSAFAAYEGVYPDPFLVGDMTIAVSGSNLTIDIPSSATLGFSYQPVLQPIVPDNFVLTIEGTPLLVTFIPDEEGASRYLRTRILVGVRADAPGVAAAALGPPSAARVGRFRRALESARSSPLPVSLAVPALAGAEAP
jgi:CubicO group peptidase (beta-lactamase class C family)